MRHVVITGFGVVSPIGDTKAELIAAMRDAKSAVADITLFDTDGWRSHLACECKHFDPKEHFTAKSLRRLDRVNQFGMVAARRALADSGLDLGACDPLRVGAFISSGIGGLGTIEREAEKGNNSGYDRISPFFIPMAIANMTAAQVAIDLGVHGNVGCPVSACAASNHALADAARNIRAGESDIIFAGGAEASINRLGVGGFSAMKALSTSDDPARASIPFDRERSGFVMGEGAAVLVLEEAEHARARGAHVYGELAGWGITCDANHITAPAEGGFWAAEAMRLALQNAAVEAQDVDYINAHGTGTLLNDAVETAAVKRALGEHAYHTHLSSTKSLTGHLLGAAGAIEAVLTLLAMQEGFVPPTANYRVPDPECDLNITPNVPVEKDITVALSNALGFGGHNVSLLFKK